MASRKVRHIFDSVYEETLLLEEFVIKYDTSGELSQNLIREDDKHGYIHLLKTTIVCSLPGTKHPSKVFTSRQMSHQQEIILRAIEKIRRREGPGKNLLTFGFNEISSNPNAQLSSSPNLEYFFPNQNVSRLNYTSWVTLLKRIGDEMMLYLLETRALFVDLKVAGQCYIQLTGTPLYQLCDHVCLKTASKFDDTKSTHLHARNVTSTKGKIEVSRSDKLKARGLKRKRGTDRQTIKPKKRLIDEITPDVRHLNEKRLLSSQRPRIVSEHPSQMDVSEALDYLATDDSHLTREDNEACQESSPADAAVERPEKLSKSAKRRLRRKRQTEGRPVQGKPDPDTRAPYSYHLPLNRAASFYSKDLRESFSTQSSLFRMRENGFVADQLLQEIFIDTEVHRKSFVDRQGLSLDGSQESAPDDTDGLKTSIPAVTSLLGELLNNHRKFPYKRILNKHAPVSRKRSPSGSNVSFYKRQRNKNKRSIPQLLEQHVPNHKVYLFLRECVLKVVPIKMFGCLHNRTVVLKNIRLLTRMGKFEKLTVGMLMDKIKTKEVLWLGSELQTWERIQCVAKWMIWLFSTYLMGQFRAYFYITESTIHRNKMFYYRKCVWKSIRQKAVAKYLQSGNLESITEGEVTELVASGRSLGVSYLRFLPKAGSLRPIINLGRRQANGTSINAQLQNIFSVLSYEKNDEMIGSAKFGTDDIHAAWREFASERKTRGDDRPLYFLKVDIESCFNSIDQKKLFDLLKELLSMEKEYIVRKYATVFVAGGRITRNFHKNVSVLENYSPDFVSLAKSIIQNRGFKNVIILDQVLHNQESTADLLRKLKAHLFNNIIKIGCKHYRQTKGITQGAKVSTLLCNYYYALMEKLHITIESDELLLRQVDDFLFVTPNIQTASNFLSLMLKGIPEFNCFVNPTKTLVNLPRSNSDIVQLPEKAWFPWCGMLFNTSTLEVCVDYSRYEGLDIGDTFTVEYSRQQGQSVLQKLLLSTRSKCHPIYLDLKLNTIGVIFPSMYKMFHLAALRFHHLCKNLPEKTKLVERTDFLFGVIFDLIQYVFLQWKRINQQVEQVEWKTNEHSIFTLAFSAFANILRRHKSCYYKLCTRLNIEVSKSLPKTANLKRVIIAIKEEGVPSEFRHMM